MFFCRQLSIWDSSSSEDQSDSSSGSVRNNQQAIEKRRRTSDGSGAVITGMSTKGNSKRKGIERGEVQSPKHRRLSSSSKLPVRAKSLELEYQLYKASFEIIPFLQDPDMVGGGYRLSIGFFVFRGVVDACSTLKRMFSKIIAALSCGHIYVLCRFACLS